VDISFEVNGRKVNPDQIGNALEKAVFRQIQDTIHKKVFTVRCPIHGTAPTQIVGKGLSTKSMNFEVYGCCNALGEQVKRVLG
jgi:hypothetical protein